VLPSIVVSPELAVDCGAALLVAAAGFRSARCWLLGHRVGPASFLPVGPGGPPVRASRCVRCGKVFAG
jgi:hypothetical protein